MISTHIALVCDPVDISNARVVLGNGTCVYIGHFCLQVPGDPQATADSLRSLAYLVEVAAGIEA